MSRIVVRLHYYFLILKRLQLVIWFLRKFHGGEYCTLPHAIEMMQVDYDKLFTVLKTEPEIEAYLNPFISAFVNDSMEQLQGQIDAARVVFASVLSCLH